eukprot:CAMPEP_0183326314 /NCGR_PEP_ID=MMETSP0160_2-20130417/81856_1 /TAXON_ID=2839 ORGANISM="Odontella Sinensis, Strain Grunow 1884" /NCGR_SAMPLE_ID=MMETSP0160_2 /ASSEMBLY_ACC=CAM_ASM_000250 /LENGTH=255 /DNA_ID=CAMNT_0025494267 /DNA_START=51 /DNA_END=814 /DNA_ORIENTATION=+
MSSPAPPYAARLIVAPSKSAVSAPLHRIVINSCSLALSSRGSFSVALSGGSLPSFLSGLSASFDEAGVDPKFDKWRVVLADERCVPSTDGDSNLKALREKFLAGVPIPEENLYGIDETLLGEDHTTSDVAKAYEASLNQALSHTGNMIDMAVLGFGPDGHTCSLFPNRPLLKVNGSLVASIEDSPKPPPKRITLTFKVLNKMTRGVVFCGAGSSKGPILKEVFAEVAAGKDSGIFDVVMVDPAPYPCGMVRPVAG